MKCGAAIAQEETIEGSFVLPNVDREVSGEMVVQETGPLSRQLELTYFNLDTGEPISRFDVELTQQLHVLATDSALSRLIHQHVEAADEEGRFTTEIAFPEPGLYHIYTDAVPSGLGQQVLRFDIQVGDRSDEDSTAGAAMTGQPAVVADGLVAASVEATRCYWMPPSS
ncbi:hypothetical protein [Devosia sp. RR2S18]|uniref:hypothetical protein n=1 Tax=Devosia rhizosphaerae TaxID=3049774 RepID=UPI002541EAB3|nr:hypothetical protein [Devosia sp. RR2S18]WIJ26897.1 hypothetical protein QOV41_09170 [Devosia sp. RR2S18]